MHIYTLVITPGPRRSAIERANELLDQAVPRYCDYWGTGGRFDDRLGKVKRPELDAWYAAQAKRRERFDAEHPLEREPSGLWGYGEWSPAYGFRDPSAAWDAVEAPHLPLLRRLQREALLDMTRLTSHLPSPLPASMVPAALVTPDPRWRIRPVKWDQDDPRWSRWVNHTVDRYRGWHCVVVADCHC